MFEVSEISLATTDRFFQYKLQYPELKGFGLKAFEKGWVLSSYEWSAGNKVLEVGGAYSWLPPHLKEKYDCEVWVADDFGIKSGEQFWLRHRSPQEYVSQHSEVKYVLERVGNPAKSSLPEKYFDVVYSVSTLEHVPNDLTPSVWQHMAQLVKPGGELIHAIDLPLPSNGGWPRLLKATVFDILSPILTSRFRLRYLRRTPRNYLSCVHSALKMPDKKYPSLNVVRMSLDPEVVTESYEHGLNRILKDNKDYRYRRVGSLLIHLRERYG